VRRQHVAAGIQIAEEVIANRWKLAALPPGMHFARMADAGLAAKRTREDR
jgi:hypothetical protein